MGESLFAIFVSLTYLIDLQKPNIDTLGTWGAGYYTIDYSKKYEPTGMHGGLLPPSNLVAFKMQYFI